MSSEKPSPEPPKSSKTHKSPIAKAVDFINKSRLRSHKLSQSNDDSNISSDVSSSLQVCLPNTDDETCLAEHYKNTNSSVSISSEPVTVQNDMIRSMAENIQLVLQKIEKQNTITCDLSSQVSVVNSKLLTITDELEALRKTNTDLVQQLDTTTAALNSTKDENSKLRDKLAKCNAGLLKPESTHEQTLVIGDSLVRDLHSLDTKLLFIKTLSGANLKKVNEFLSSYEKQKRTFKEVCILAGTNDFPCQTNPQKT